MSPSSKGHQFCSVSGPNTGSPLTQSSGGSEALALQHIQGSFQQSMCLAFNAWMIPVSFRHVLKYERVLEVLSILRLSSPKWINPNTLCKLWAFQLHTGKRLKNLVHSRHVPSREMQLYNLFLSETHS